MPPAQTDSGTRPDPEATSTDAGSDSGSNGETDSSADPSSSDGGDTDGGDTDGGDTDGSDTEGEDTDGSDTDGGDSGGTAISPVCAQSIAIPADGTPLEIDLVFPEGTDVVTQILLSLDVEHAAVGELSIELEHDGMTVVVFDQACADADDLLVQLSDAAAAQIDCNNTAVDERVLPANALTVFDTHDVAGTWVLRLQDRSDNATSGRLVEACLEL